MVRWGNPSVRGWTRRAQNGSLGVETTPATYGGVVRHTILLCLVTMIAAVAVEASLWFAILRPEVAFGNMEYWMLGLIGLGVISVVWIVMHIIILFAPTTAKILGPACCLVQGLFLGVAAFVFDIFVPGISLAALLGTGVVFLFVLFLYKGLGVRIKSSFWRVMLIFFVSYLVAQLAMVIACLLLDDWAMFWIEAISSLLCIGMACFTIIWDIQNVDTLVQAGVDKIYEWPVAYALTTSLVYLYVQILRVLFRVFALISSVRGKK